MLTVKESWKASAYFARLRGFSTGMTTYNSS